jgi:hypothetical protein
MVRGIQISGTNKGRYYRSSQAINFQQEDKMKRLFLVLFLLIASSASAASIKFAWDAMPVGQVWQGVRVYDITNASTPVLVCESTESTTTGCTLATAPTTARTYAAKSYIADAESSFSNSVVWPGIPAAPTGMKYTITITMEAK